MYIMLSIRMYTGVRHTVNYISGGFKIFNDFNTIKMTKNLVTYYNII